MKKVTIPVIALLMLFAATPVMAPATKIPVTGEFFGYATDTGTQWISEEGIIQTRGGAGEGEIVSEYIPGIMSFTFNAAFDPTTGTGRAWGTFVSTDPEGNPILKGNWLVSVSNWGYYIEGPSTGHGIGAYEGMHWSCRFWGYNSYFSMPPYPDPPIYFYLDGTILSPHG